MALMKRKRIGLNDAMSVVTKFVNACNRHDADGVAACLHPDFDSIQPMYPSRNFRGADQVRRNWQAIFDAEPGFRLTVLRSAAMDDTVWLELHGAGRDAEVAGIFIMGIVGDRIRWARIYSALVEPVVAGVGGATDPAASLQEVPPVDEPPATASGDLVQEDLIAPVLDMERSGRRRRRRRGSDDEEGVEAQPGADVVPVVDGADVEVPPEMAVAAEAQTEAESQVDPEGETVVQAEPDLEVAGAAAAEILVVEEADVVVVEGPEVAAAVVTEEADRPEPDAVDVTVVDEDSGPTEAEEMVTLTEPDPPTGTEALAEPTPQAAAEDPVAVVEPAPEPTKRWFGKRGRP